MTRVWDTPRPSRLRARKPLIVRPAKQIDPALKRDIYRRQQGLCACCGRPLPVYWPAHHRQLRSQGGQDSVCNLVGLRPSCHRTVHNHPARSAEFGYIVLRDEDPATKPLHLFDGRLVLLRPDGAFLEVTS